MIVLPNVGGPQLLFKLNVVYDIQGLEMLGCGVCGRGSIVVGL